MLTCSILLAFHEAAHGDREYQQWNHCRGGREEPPSTSAGAGEAPPAPGLTRRTSRQSDQQDQQVSHTLSAVSHAIGMFRLAVRAARPAPNEPVMN